MRIQVSKRGLPAKATCLVSSNIQNLQKTHKFLSPSPRRLQHPCLSCRLMQVLACHLVRPSTQSAWLEGVVYEKELRRHPRRFFSRTSHSNHSTFVPQLNRRTGCHSAKGAWLILSALFGFYFHLITYGLERVSLFRGHNSLSLSHESLVKKQTPLQRFLTVRAARCQKI